MIKNLHNKNDNDKFVLTRSECSNYNFPIFYDLLI